MPNLSNWRERERDTEREGERERKEPYLIFLLDSQPMCK